ncbi:MAG: SDR family oxidoreductase [Candidatus Rokubacteria bacterium]|nr:SDR family oxidoreductase [Candidatus Rokubacteria bacterium]MBI3824443.1 SDR family oxidoreductase [Candidatus Rokubacteria bacterium]
MATTPRVALITGGGRGIGREIALAYARAGLAVAVAARTREQVEETAAVGKTGARAFALVLDVTDAAAIARGVGEVVSALGPVDVLVNNAGVAESATLARTDPEMWERHMRVNATGPYLLTREVLPGMLARRWGRVINVASLAGLYGAPYVTAYTASKHALVGFTRALAAEVTGKGVTVNAICPGYAATDVVWNAARNIVAKTGTTFDDAVRALARINPGGRLIEPAEVAAVAVRLLDDEAANGEMIVLDGS